MYGAILGDIIGSPFEFDRGDKTKDFELFSRAMGFTDKKFNSLPKCKEIIESYYETQEHFWARELIWAVQTILNDNTTLNWKHIRVYVVTLLVSRVFQNGS